MEAHNLIMAFQPVAEGIAAGAITALVIAAPVFAFCLYGLWRSRATFGGKSAREAAMNAEKCPRQD